MKKPLYAILDIIAGFYSPVFTAENDAHAIRMMLESVNPAHARDYVLFRLATYNSDNGEITPNEPRRIANAHEALKDIQS